MSSQTKLIKDILSIYDTILENKNVSEATDVYDNVDFADGKLPGSYPSKDTINTALLQDIETAAKAAGVKIDITTAISGHKHTPSRHPSGNAVDIAMINGKAVSPSNRADADKFVQALVSMGYTLNQEKSNPKAVLTFGFEGHDDHVHVSNTTSSTSAAPKSIGSSTSTTTTDTSSTEKKDNFARQMGNALLKGAGITEAKFYSSFGNDHSLRAGEIIIPKDRNTRIKSPVNGVINLDSNSQSCKNKLTIKFKLDGEHLHLQYCGLEPTKLKSGDSVVKGDILGRPESDVRVTLFDEKGYRQYIDTNKEVKGNDNSDNNFDYTPDRSTNEYSKLLKKSYRYLKNNLFKKDPKEKLDENINRIKGLIK